MFWMILLWIRQWLECMVVHEPNAGAEWEDRGAQKIMFKGACNPDEMEFILPTKKLANPTEYSVCSFLPLTIPLFPFFYSSGAH